MLILIILTLIGLGALIMGFFEIRIPFFTNVKERESLNVKSKLLSNKKVA